MRVAGLVFCGLGLAACQVTVPIAPPPGVVLARDGLRVPGQTLEVGFGRARPGADAALIKLLGQPQQRTPPAGGCGLAQMEWPGGVIANFTATAFVGWQLAPGRALSDFPVAPEVTAPQAGQTC